MNSLQLALPSKGVFGNPGAMNDRSLALDRSHLLQLSQKFANGVGTFFSDKTYEGRAVRVRGIFTPIRPGLARWEQAYSIDGGKSWEANYVRRYTRRA